MCSVEPGRGAAAQPGGEQTARVDAQTHRRDCEAALLQQDRGRGHQAPGGQDQASAPEQVRMLLQQNRGRGQQAPGGQDQTSAPEQVRMLLQHDRGRGHQAPGGQDQTSAPEQVCYFHYCKGKMS